MRHAALIAGGAALAALLVAAIGAPPRFVSEASAQAAPSQATCTSSPFDGSQWGQTDYYARSDQTGDGAQSEATGGGQYEAWKRLVDPETTPVPLVYGSGNTGDQGKVGTMASSIGRYSALYREASGALCIWTCTAAQIGPGIFLTNQHCAHPPKAVGPLIKAEVRMGYLNRLAAVDTAADAEETPFLHFEKTPETVENRPDPLKRAGIAFELPTTPVAEDPTLDFAVFRLRPAASNLYMTDYGLLGADWLPRPLKLARGRPLPFQSIAVVGHPLATPLHAAVCAISVFRAGADAMSGALGRDPPLRYPCRVFPGNSGSPIIEMGDGAMVGIHRDSAGSADATDAVASYDGTKGLGSFIGSVLRRLPEDLQRDIASDPTGGMCRNGGGADPARVREARNLLSENRADLNELLPAGASDGAKLAAVEFSAGATQLSDAGKAQVSQFIDALSAAERERVIVLVNVIDNPHFCSSLESDSSYLPDALEQARTRHEWFRTYLRRELRVKSMDELAVANLTDDVRFNAASAGHATKRNNSAFLVVAPEVQVGGQ